MNTLPSWGPFMGGAVASNVLLVFVSHWLLAMREIFKSRETGRKNRALVGQLLVGSLLNAGPWIILVAGYFSFYVASESWAPSFFAGAAAWILFVSALITFTMWRRKHHKQNENAA